MIPQSQISKLSNRLLREYGGRRIPENVLERDYCRLAAQMAILSEFDGVYRAVKRAFRQAKITEV